MPAADLPGVPGAAVGPAQSAPPTHSPWLIANVLGQISFGLLAMTLCLPSMQEWGSIFDTRQADVQLTFSGYVAPTARCSWCTAPCQTGTADAPS